MSPKPKLAWPRELRRSQKLKAVIAFSSVLLGVWILEESSLHCPLVLGRHNPLWTTMTRIPVPQHEPRRPIKCFKVAVAIDVFHLSPIVPHARAHKPVVHFRLAALCSRQSCFEAVRFTCPDSAQVFRHLEGSHRALPSWTCVLAPAALRCNYPIPKAVLSVAMNKKSDKW